jgi:TetR/AcrR family transcriptional repressor of nem operon
MKVSREQVAENREAILRAAGRLFRDRGFEAVGVAEIMSAAGLTHGGFYGHFKSKDDLIAQTLSHLLEKAKRDVDFATFVETYLSADHRDKAATGCPTAALAAAIPKQSQSARAAMTQAQSAVIERLSKKVEGRGAAARRRAAIGSWSTMVGAMILSRSVDDPELADEILEEARAWISAK